MGHNLLKALCWSPAFSPGMPEATGLPTHL